MFQRPAPSYGEWLIATTANPKPSLSAPYPLVTLKEARDKRDAAKKLLLNDIDPNEYKKTKKEAEVITTEHTFENIYNEWFFKFYENKDKDTKQRLNSYFRNYVLPYIGKRPISEIKAAEVLDVIQRMEAKGILESAHRVKNYCGQVFKYACATGRAEQDVTYSLKGALPPSTKKHYPTITDPVKVGALLRAIDSYDGKFSNLCALKLAPLLFVRPGELRGAEWEEFQFHNAEWHIPEGRMKKKDQKHIVPLSRQALAIIEELLPLTGQGKYLFPGRTKDRPISDNTLNGALRRLGYAKDVMCMHGFRAMASTLLNEQGYNRDWIERQLAHCERNKIRAAYNYAEFLPERRKMMQEWADYLTLLKTR